MTLGFFWPHDMSIMVSLNHNVFMVSILHYYQKILLALSGYHHKRSPIALNLWKWWLMFPITKCTKCLTRFGDGMYKEHKMEMINWENE